MLAERGEVGRRVLVGALTVATIATVLVLWSGRGGDDHDQNAARRGNGTSDRRDHGCSRHDAWPARERERGDVRLRR